MKKILFVLSLLLIISLSPASGQIEADSTGYPGDHFSLEGALELFKESNSPESFEKKLNNEKEGVNNLDLNEDGEVDYIRVIDNMEEDVHAIVLQAVLGEKEAQDIAVIEIEKTGREEALLQIIGNEDVYGKMTIVEPFAEEGESGGKGGPSVNLRTNRIIVNVWLWPCVSYIYRPAYTVWVSPWYWSYYPRWWNPWRPRPWRTHYHRTVVYRPHYRVVSTHRVVHAHRVYTPRKTSSVTVKTRTTTIRASKSKQVDVQKKARVTDTKQVGKVDKTTNVKKSDGDNVRQAEKTTSRKAVRTDDGEVKVGQKTSTQARTKNAEGNKATISRDTKTGVKKNDQGIKATRKTDAKRSRTNTSGDRVKGKRQTNTKAAKRGNQKAGVKTTRTGKKKRSK